MGCAAMSEGAGGAGDCNVLLGYKAGLCLSGAGANRNIFLGACAANTTTTGANNIALGFDVELPDATANCQLAIGDGTNRWIIGDSSFNVCLAGSTIKAMNSGGIFCATKFCGDGSCLTGISAGFEQDAQGNLVAGTGAGAAKDADTCFNIMLGCNAGAALCGGYGHSILMGCHTGKSITLSLIHI